MASNSRAPALLLPPSTKRMEEGAGRRRKREAPNINELDNLAMEKAQLLQSKLDPQFPSFIRLLRRSQVSGGFWLGIPTAFCSNHLPKRDIDIVLEDEDGIESVSKYLLRKTGLSGGWRGFSTRHNLREGDAAVFHLVAPSKFKVYIIRSESSDEVDGAIALLNLDPNSRHEASVPDRDDEQVKDFVVVYDGMDLTARISENGLRTYYQLCCSQKAVLHQNLRKGLDSELVVGMIHTIHNTLDYMKNSDHSTASLHNLDIYYQHLNVSLSLGLNVGFLLTRLQQVIKICSDSEPQEIEEVKSKRARAIKEGNVLQAKLLENRRLIKNLDSQIEKHSDRLKAVYNQVVNAPW